MGLALGAVSEAKMVLGSGLEMVPVMEGVWVLKWGGEWVPRLGVKSGHQSEMESVERWEKPRVSSWASG